MRILLVHNRYRSSSPGGEDRVVDQEHEALEMAGHEVRRFERANDEIAGYGRRRKVQVPIEAVWNRRSAQALDVVIESFGPDVVHLHNLFPLVSGSALRSCARNRVPCVATLHNYLQVCVAGSLHRAGGTCTECVGRSVAAPGIVHGCYHGSCAASAVAAASLVASRPVWRTVPSAYILLSDAQRRLLEPLQLPPWRCFVKPNLVHPIARRSSPENLVVFAGRLTEAKGLRVLMRAWDGYTAGTRDPRLRLAIAGTGPLGAEVGSWAAARPSVEMHGLLGRDATARLVARATAVVVPSEWQEPFGLVVAEAMAAGVGPVATAHGAFPELIEDRVDGLLYPPGDDVALSGLLQRLERSPELVTSLGDAARRTYERRFTPAKVVAELEAIYQFAAENPTWREDRPSRLRGGAVGVPSAAPAVQRSTESAGEAAVAAFWQAHPCGDAVMGGLSERYRLDYERFFTDYDRRRYEVESHIPSCLDRLEVEGARVLEIGLGQGSESEQLIRRGARWTGLDLTAASVERVRTRLELRQLPFEDVLLGSATDIPADDGSFDLVFSHGVLHHVPDILAAQREVHRVLRPGGRLVAMVYARRSLNYWISIALLRRLAVLGLWSLRRRGLGGLAGAHLRNAEEEGVLGYLRMARFVHANTDGPDNPYSRVYDLATVRRDFPSFSIVGARKYFMHAPPLPVHGLPGGRLMGWHLWVELARRDDVVPASVGGARPETAGRGLGGQVHRRRPPGGMPAAGPGARDPAPAGH